jgi:hypothetical protein
MRTKTALLIAAVCAAGIATSSAQVFSVNAVGYVNKEIPGNGFAMVANPLKAATNTINALFTGVPPGFQVYIFQKQGQAFDVGAFDDLEGGFVPASVGNAELLPGQGVFVKNPTAQAITITFVGEVMQGHLTTDLVPGLQIVSSQVPQAGTATELGLTGALGDQIYQFNTATQQYDVSSYDDLENSFLPALKPLGVGEAFFLRKAAAGQWVRDFNVNQ